MMKKVKFSLVVVSAALLAACTAPTSTSQQNQPQASGTESEQSMTASIRELLGMGKNIKCTFSTSETDGDGVKTDTSGTVYVSGKNMAEDVKIVSSDKEEGTLNMKVISDSTTVYTWNPAMKTQGMKMSFLEIDKQGQTSDKTTSEQQKNMDEKVDMKCSNWNVDSSVFVVPSDVKFTDLSEMMKNIPTAPANIPNYGTQGVEE